MYVFDSTMDDREDFLRQVGGGILVAGDFNAKAREWGEETDSRGTKVMEMVSRLDLVTLNAGRTTTLSREGCRETIIDISLS